MPKKEPRLEEVRTLLQEVPGPDLEARAAALARQQELVKPRGGLGRLEEVAVWLATWQGAQPLRMERPRLAIFAANHGIARRGVSIRPGAFTQEMMKVFIDGGGAVNQLAALVKADLRVYEMALEQPSADFTQGPALSEEACARALAYGMMAVEPGFDVMALGALGVANSISAAALSHGLFGGEAADWLDQSEGLDDEMLARQVAVVGEGVAANRQALDDPLKVLSALGGLELAAIVGAIIACRLARIPVILDGFVCSAAAAVLHAVEPQLLDHCLVAQRWPGPGHARLLEKLDKSPLVDLELGVEEGVGAALAIQLLQAAAVCHNSMATWRTAGLRGTLSAH